MDAVTAVLDEALMETIGASRKKWALLVVAFVAGALGAVWLARRTRSARSASIPADVAAS